MRFRVNAPQVISETIDGETVIIDLGTGFYYSVRDDDAGIWSALSHGCSSDEVVNSVLRRCDASEVEVTAAVAELTHALTAEGLLVPNDEPLAPVTALSAVAASERGTFRRPTLSKYTDMQDLVLLDPVHDVAEAGWPQRHEAGASTNGTM